MADVSNQTIWLFPSQGGSAIVLNLGEAERKLLFDNQAFKLKKNALKDQLFVKLSYKAGAQAVTKHVYQDYIAKLTREERKQHIAALIKDIQSASPMPPPEPGVRLAPTLKPQDNASLEEVYGVMELETDEDGMFTHDSCREVEKKFQKNLKKGSNMEDMLQAVEWLFAAPAHLSSAPEPKPQPQSGNKLYHMLDHDAQCNFATCLGDAAGIDQAHVQVHTQAHAAQQPINPLTLVLTALGALQKWHAPYYKQPGADDIRPPGLTGSGSAHTTRLLSITNIVQAMLSQQAAPELGPRPTASPTPFSMTPKPGDGG